MARLGESVSVRDFINMGTWLPGGMEGFMQRILVVDDAEVNRELLYGMLRDDYMVELAKRHWRN